MRGSIIWFDAVKGFGFISGSDGLEYFVHHSEVVRHKGSPNRLVKGQSVEFDQAPGQPNPQAVDVRLVSGKQVFEEANQPLSLKKNPFTPQDPVTDPRKFAGRRQILRSAVDSLYNSRNILITGPRGIGKSSLAYQLLYMTQGEEEILNKLQVIRDGPIFFSVSGDHRCSAGNSLTDIARGLVVTLADNAGVNLGDEVTKTSSGIDLKIFRAVEEKTSSQVSATDIANWFTNQVVKIFNASQKPYLGMSFLIDEIDQLDPEVPLSSFLKAAVEKCRLDGHRSVCFILGGVTGTVTSLIAQHPSSRRLFERLELQTMSYQELEELVKLTLEDSSVAIDDDATERLVALSNSFPQPLHLLGYHAFRLDVDDRISLEDAEAAKTYIVRFSLRQDYADKLQKLARGAMSDIIQVFAEARHPTVTVEYLERLLPQMSRQEILGNTSNLVRWSILEKLGRQVYSFQEPLFKIYCRWVYGIDDD